MTQKGMDLRKKAKNIPKKMGASVNLTPDDAQKLYEILYKVLGNIEGEGL